MSTRKNVVIAVVASIVGLAIIIPLVMFFIFGISVAAQLRQGRIDLETGRIEMFTVVSEYLLGKYGFDESEITLAEYSPFIGGGGGFMGGGGERQAWMTVTITDGTKIKVIELRRRGPNGETIYVDDYQLMETHILSAEYLSDILGVDISFVEFYTAPSRSSPHSPMPHTDEQRTKYSIGTHLLEFLANSNAGIAVYFNADFSNDDLNSIFEKSHNAFLDSSLADTKAEIILIAHDIELDIVRFDVSKVSSISLDSFYANGNYYHLLSGEWREGPIRHGIRPRHEHIHAHYIAYALRMYGSDRVGLLTKRE
jgi:hypothetical protein